MSWIQNATNTFKCSCSTLLAVRQYLSRLAASMPDIQTGLDSLDSLSAQVGRLCAVKLLVGNSAGSSDHLSFLCQICRLLPKLRENFDKTHEQKSHHCACTPWQRRNMNKNILSQGCHFAKNTSWKPINLTEGMRRYRYSQKISWDIPANRFETVLIIAMILPDAH